MCGNGRPQFPTPALTYGRKVSRSRWLTDNTSLQNGISLKSPLGTKSSPTLNGTSRGAVHVEWCPPIQSRGSPMAQPRAWMEGGKKWQPTPHRTRLSGKVSLTLSHCAFRYVRHAMPFTYTQALMVAWRDDRVGANTFTKVDMISDPREVTHWKRGLYTTPNKEIALLGIKLQRVTSEHDCRKGRAGICPAQR